MEEFKGDKRTKEYKEWKARFNEENAKKSVGLGDTIEKVLEATGVKAMVKGLFGEDCGCDERKELLNKTFQYPVQKCLEEDEYIYLDEFFARSISRSIPLAEWQKVVTIYNRVFDRREKACETCGTYNVKVIYIPLKKYYESYKAGN